jgi:hypothetical protein
MASPCLTKGMTSRLDGEVFVKIIIASIFKIPFLFLTI